MILKNIAKGILTGITKKSPEIGAKILYTLSTKSIPHLKNPRNFNDKMTLLKLKYYNNDKRLPNLVDKYEVRNYVKKIGCEEILNELYGVYDNPEEIDFNTLPEKFALKCTHGCAYNIICNDKSKLDIEKTKKKLNKWLKETYGYPTQELQYIKIKPRIIAEKNLCDENGKMPKDYKIYCFDGKPECIKVISDREKGGYKANYYDLDWNELDYGKRKWTSKFHQEKPENLKEMLEYAKKLSNGFKFVRVDLYDQNNKVIFGELTFTPSRGYAPYYSKKGNIELGKKLKL